MINVAHTRAQGLSAEAAATLRAGDVAAARKLYAEAAVLEREALERIPSEKRRTWGAVAVSLAALLYKAKQLHEAELTLYALLANRELLPDARDQLRDLLSTVRDELSLPDGLEYAGQGFELTMRGGEVGEGSAPLDLVVQESEQVRNLLVRSIERRAGFPFRPAGKLPAPEIIDMIQARATQARIGSFRFTVRLAAPAQMKLFPELAAPKLEGLTGWLSKFMSAAASSHEGRAEALRELAPEKEYRVALLKLVRSIAPHGKRVSEVEFTPVEKAPDGAAERHPVVLNRDTKRALEEAIRMDAPAPPPEQEESVEGTLRAVHLNDKWLIVVLADGREVKCHFEPDNVLDDMVGPMVNHRVAVLGKWRGAGTHRKFELRDIDLSDDEKD